MWALSETPGMVLDSPAEEACCVSLDSSEICWQVKEKSCS